LLINIVLVAAGLGLLTIAADHFVEGAARVSAALRISPVVVGALVIGFGTSAPEMLVSGLAAAQGSDELGVGNIIGSNVANLSLVLGAGALVLPISVTSATLRREAPMAFGAVVVFAVLLQGGLSRLDGIILAALTLAAVSYIIRSSRDEQRGALAHDIEELYETDEVHPVKLEAARTIAGLVGTVVGAQLLVLGATRIATEAGLSDGFVGFTLVAVGTSLPELVTTMAATRKGETDLIVGNLLGSNLFNSLTVGAVVGLVGDGVLDHDALASTGAIIMVVIALIATLAMLTQNRVERWEGTVLLIVWLASIPLVPTNAGDRVESALAPAASGLTSSVEVACPVPIGSKLSAAPRTRSIRTSSSAPCTPMG